MDIITTNRSTNIQRPRSRPARPLVASSAAALVAAAALALLPACHQDYDKNIPGAQSSSSAPPAGSVLQTKTYSGGLSSGAIIDGLVTGPDGRVWFTETNTAKVGAATTAGVITEYAVTAPSGYSCVTPQNIIVGPDNNLWAATFCGQLIKVTTAGFVTVYGINPNASFSGITIGPDGNLWVGDQTNSVIDVVSTSGAAVRSIPLPAGAIPSSLALGSDNNVWVADFGLAAVERVTSSGTVTSFNSGIPTGETVRGITAASDGNLYFTAPASISTAGNGVGRISTSGKITMLGTLSSGASPVNITADNKGNAWFRENTTGINACGRVVESTGAITEYSLAGITAPNVPDDGGGDVTGTAVIGPDGNLWMGGSAVLYVATPP